MRFVVIKLKHIALVFGVLCSAAVIYFSTYKVASVFNVNGREIPIYSVERGDNKISLTFDCAWNDDDIISILDTLDKYNCKATFFVVGDWAEKYGDSLKLIYDRGHEIGNHSYNHSDYTKLSAEGILEDLEKCDKVVESITGEKPYLMRAPSGGYNNTVVKTVEDSGRMYIQWSVDGIDYGDADADDIYSRTVGKTDKGDIILLHNGTENTATVLPKIIEALECKYEFVTVSELIYRDDYIIDNTGRQFHLVN